MWRRVLVGGVVGLLVGAACWMGEPPPRDPPVMPTPDAGPAPVGCEVSGARVGRSRQALRAAETAPADDREPVLVRFRSDARGDARDVQRLGGEVRREFPAQRVVAARLTPAQRSALAKDPAVERIAPDRKVYALGWTVPSASALLQAPGVVGSVGEVTPGLKQVQADSIWDSNGDGMLDPGAPTGAGIKVCVIDSGIDHTHPELRTPYYGGKDFVDGDDDPTDASAEGVAGGGHGTHVAGTIAAQLGNGARVNPYDTTLDRNGVIGVAPGVQLLIARVLDVDGSGRTSDVIAALEWCTEQGARIVNLSLGSEERSQDEEDAFVAAEAEGVLSIAATGNSGSELQLGFPAGYASVMSVGAVEADGRFAAFSQAFPEPDSASGPKAGSVVGPGTEVQSTMIVGQGTVYTEELTVDGQPFAAEGLEFARTGRYSGALVDCGRSESVTSCGEGATCDGFVAYVERSELPPADQARNAILQGARAIIVGNDDPASDGELDLTLGDASPDWVPTVAVTTVDAALIRPRIGSVVTLSLAGTDYAVQAGTSMATPHVSGVAALVWSARPGLTHLEVRQLLQDTAKDLGPSGYDAHYGFGLVQARDALVELTGATPPPGGD